MMAGQCIDGLQPRAVLRRRARLYVQRGRFDEVVDGVAQIAKSIKMGPGMEPGTQMGPLVSEEQLRLVTGFLESGEAEGATALAAAGGSATVATSLSPPC